MNTNYGHFMDNQKNDNNNDTNSSSDQVVNPYWPKAQVLQSAVNRRPEPSKPAFSLLFELSNVLKNKLIRNDSHLNK